MTATADATPKTSAPTSNSSSISSSRTRPSLIVFDLDNTLWTPELYQLRKLQRNKKNPIAGKDVTLFPAAASIIQKIRSSPRNDDDDDNPWSNTRFAVASRTKSVDWATDLLVQFGLDDFFHYKEIFPGDKKTHFRNLREKSGVEYSEMLFFDDSRDGRFGNCVPVSELGVLSVHCPGGLHCETIWTRALECFGEWSGDGSPAGTVVEWEGSVTTTMMLGGGGGGEERKVGERFEGIVKTVKRDKRFGFISYGDGRTRDMFFHFSSLSNVNDDINRGDKVSFNIVNDPQKRKDAASDVKILSRATSSPPPRSDDTKTDKNTNTVNMRVFSMNLPFAALLANGYKTLETRNGTMFTPYPEGTKMLLHVGQRRYPDGDRHIDVMRGGGLSDEDIAALKRLPPGFSKGMAVAIVEIGKTFDTTLEERCVGDFERRVAAFGADSGRRATEIKRVEYLKRGVKVSGRGGVFKVDIEKDVLPDGWL
eukprot:CAMPEP_0172498796 /NCGR_PEP_ID=MMETSP1066-20121228/117518_1 /TAXON_ID=671091 /ORGANISM="Coscinodiscus wailesii, Strain CCMP2513" /LENGTH=479 /DNA_ID=CAMNT_0013272225 /DNA_START=207 /DNA_END=1646 /DNA_ORIENTATION=-